MVRVSLALVAGLGIVALVALSGAQGARVGSWEIPAISPWWVVAVAAFVLLLSPQRPARSKRRGALGVALAVSFFSLFFFRSQALHPKTSLDFVVDGEREARSETLQIERRNELRRLTGKRRNVTLSTRAVLEIPQDGTYAFYVSCDDSCDVTLGNEVTTIEGTRSIELPLERGALSLEVRYRQTGGPARLVLSWDTPRFLDLLPIDYYLRSPSGASRARFTAHVALVACSLWFVALGLYLVELGRVRSRWIRKPLVPVVLATLVVCYGGALRFEALLAHSGLAERNETLAVVHGALLPWLPAFGVFQIENAPEDPFRADVRSYLDRADSLSLTGFYAPSFREPFYVLLTWAGVAWTGGELGILVQSFVFSCLTLPLFCVVARRLHGAWWAVGLLVPVSLHEWLVLEAPTGYRMSAYSFFLLAFVSLVVLGPSGPRAGALQGVLGGLLTLVRLSALSAMAPVVALRLVALARAKRLHYALAFLLALSILVGPFLWSNFRAHGDPFYSVSFHTEFWLRAEGLDRGEGPVGLTRYFSDFGRAGALVKGTFLGLTVLPLRTFWNGLRYLPILSAVTLGLSVVGLLALSKERNRYLAAAYFGHLLPFAYIQNFPSGEMPRFVMPAFFFLVLAAPSTLTLARAIATLKTVRPTLLILAGVLASLPVFGDERVERLPAKYREWIEKEVVYVIAARERDAFLDLKSEEEWEAFIEAFWRRRDPDPLTPMNEFREEHYRRIEFADRNLGREAAVPGWMTDRGRMYIVLGAPRDREEFTSVPYLYPAELWFYDANRDKGLPPLYLLFFQEYHAGPYRLFNHLLDGPEDLMPAQPLDPDNSRRMAYEILQEINPGLAHATITMRADQGAAAGIMQPDRSALDFQGLLADIYASPFRRIDTRYVDEAKSAMGIVETQYIFNYVPSVGIVNVLPGPSESSFVHYAIEIEPRHMTLARDPDKNLYYTTFELQGEVTAKDGETVIASFSKEPYVELTESQFREVGSRPFSYRDMFPLVSGEFRFRLVLKNRARSEYTIFESDLVVPERGAATPFLGKPVLLYGMSRIEGGDESAGAAYRTYRIGRTVLEPNAKNAIAIGDYVMAHVPLANAGSDFTLSSKVVSRDDPTAPPRVETHRLDFYELPLVLRIPIENAAGGRYQLEVELRAPGAGDPLTETLDFDVSPLSQIPRPWAVRDSVEGERLGPLRAALAEQAMRQGNLAEARRLAEDALGSDPNSIPARLLLARLDLDSGDFVGVIRLLEPARAQAPRDADVLLVLGDAHFRVSHFDRARELFETAAALRRPDPSLLNALGVCHAELGNRSEAISYFERSLELDPSQTKIQTLLDELRAR